MTSCTFHLGPRFQVDGGDNGALHLSGPAMRSGDRRKHVRWGEVMGLVKRSGENADFVPRWTREGEGAAAVRAKSAFHSW